jgi:TPR repeat protein
MAPAEYAGQLSEGYQLQHRRLSQKRPGQHGSRFSLREAAFTMALMAMVSGLSGMAVYRVTSSPHQSQAPEAVLSLSTGDRMFDQGDVLAARASYARALALGEVSAALRLGKTYDPSIFTDLKIQGLQPDKSMAQRYYQQAADAGISDAKALLTKLQLAEE